VGLHRPALRLQARWSLPRPCRFFRQALLYSAQQIARDTAYGSPLSMSAADPSMCYLGDSLPAGSSA
jgi:hypothetical protein